jgi:shikimate kinase
MAQIYLIGFMGTGKSTVARELSHLLQRAVIDTDAEIVSRAGMSIADYFARWGEAAFRDLEHQVIRELSEGAEAIISCGGGVVLRQDNVDCMKDLGTVVLLTAEPATVLERVRYDTKRPLLEGKKNVTDIAALMATRMPYYQAAADVMVATDQRSPKNIAKEIIRRIDKTV